MKRPRHRLLNTEHARRGSLRGVERDDADPARLGRLAIRFWRDQSRGFAGVRRNAGLELQCNWRATARNAALIDAGADLRIKPQAKIGLCYWGQHVSTAQDNGLRGTLTWMF